jgi:hypothetical protein
MLFVLLYSELDHNDPCGIGSEAGAMVNLFSIGV